LITGAIIIVPNELKVSARIGGESGISDIDLNSSYIHSIVETLSDIVKDNPKGRSFGTPGEQLAKEYIVNWMENLDLWTMVELISSEYSQIFWDSGHWMNLSDDLQVKNQELSIYNDSIGTNIEDFMICPRWNWTALERNHSIFIDRDRLTHVFEENNLSIHPRPPYVSTFLNNLILSLIDEMLDDEEIMSGNDTALFDYLLHQIELNCTISFAELMTNPTNASNIPGFTNDTEIGRNNDYVFISEDMSFNPVYNHTYWDGWNEALDLVLSTQFVNSHHKIYRFFDSLRRQKQCIEMMIWQLDLRFKGLILYDHNNDTYDMNYNMFYVRPTIYINRSVGLDIVHNLDTHTLNYTLDQEWNENVESYNVIGQLNATDTSNPNEYILIECLYDGWHNQASGDSAISMGILLAIAKYFQDHNIIPKTNIRFVAFGGEEVGGRGAFSYIQNHSEDTIPLVIDLNQFGYSQSYPRQALWIFSNNLTVNSTIHAIAEDTHFVERVNNATDLWSMNVSADPYFSDHTAFYKDGKQHTIISFLKENTSFPLFTWRLHHRDGLNHSMGDSMAYYNSKEVNATASLIFNVTRYYTMNPNCWFDNTSFTVFDSPNDGDILNDSIRTNFTIHSVLPSDKVRVELDLGYEIGGEGVVITNADNTDYLLTSRSQNESYVFTIPDNVVDGNYSVSFKLYNSTGRINKIVYGSSGTYYNDTSGTSNWSHLYHPLGYTKIGNTYKCINDNISGSVFTANEYGTAENITAYINQDFYETAHYKCMLYRANDSTLIGTTTENWTSLGGQTTSPWWAVFNFTGTKPLLVKGSEYVITCWGDNVLSGIYYNDSSIASTARFDNETYGDPPNPANFTDESRYYSIYCGYTPDITPPQITDVTANPHTVGFGYNVTITANITDEFSSVDLVKVQIGYPGGESGNYTMSHSSGDTYQYLFTDTWLVGQYNYTIWAMDNSTNSNSSSGYHFHVSADASISIATLQDSYSGNQYINITDPPNPPENYTLVGRGLTWDKYYDAITEQNILEVSTGPINYQEENGTWTPINNTISQLTADHPAYFYGYRTGNDHGLYGVYFKSNAQNEWPVAFTYNRSDDPIIYGVRSKLVGVGYVDPQSDWAYEFLQNIQNSQAQINDNSITYPGVFTGTDVNWSYGNTGLKEEITLSNTTKTVLQNHPPSLYGLNNESSYLVFITKLDYQNLNLYNASGLLDGNVTISDAGVDFKDALGQFKCALPLGEAYELNNESIRQKLTYRIIHLNGNTYLLSGLKVSDLTAMMFPVVIDPTLSVVSLSNDGYIYSSSTTYNTAWTASSGTIDSSAIYLSIGQKKDQSLPPIYYIYRGFVLFNTSVLPSNAYLDSAVLSLYKKNDYSGTDFMLTVQNGQPTYPHNPLQTGDYAKSHYSGNGGGLNTTNFVNGRNNITLTDLTWINKTGITKLCLRSSRDISGTTPTGVEYVNVYSANAMDPNPNVSYKPKLIITYRNQSKIKNTGSTDIKGYLLIQVQFFETGKGGAPRWIVDNDTINETSPRTINSSSQLALDTIFNGLVRASDLAHGTGTYRIYAAFRDPEGNILRTDDDVELVSWWQFSKT
jgi:hypothetical protein